MIPEWKAKAYEYNYRIRWSPSDQGYIASVAEFPTMQSPPEITPQAALHSLMACVVRKVHHLDVDAHPRLQTLAQSWFGSEALPRPRSHASDSKP
jgi:hypothetical protein